MRALLLLILLAGCAGPAVRVRSDRAEDWGKHGDRLCGWGVSLAGGVVGTAAHLVGTKNEVEGLDGRWWPASQCAEIPAHPEPIVLLRTRAPLPSPAELRPTRAGDSGAPIFVDGECVGLVWGTESSQTIRTPARGLAAISSARHGIFLTPTAKEER